MRAIEIPKKGGPLTLVVRPLPDPQRGDVRVRVEACGICHSDSLAVEGHFPGVTYPLIPGHEIAGRINALGEGVEGWREGRRVGVGWFGGACYRCEPCRRGDMVDCRNLRIPGFTYDGGYAVVGHESGTSIESEDTLRFSALTGVKPMIEAMPREKAPEAYERMMKGDARFHMVLSMAS